MSGHDNFLIRTIQNANDIVDVVGEHVALKRSSRNFIGLCPFHREKTPSFSVSPEKQIFKCFGCGAGGDVIKFIQKIMNLTFREAIEVLARRANIALPEKKASAESPHPGASKSDIFRANLWAASFFTHILWKTDIGESGRKYLQNRGLTEEACRTFGLGFSPPAGRNLLETAARQGFNPPLLVSAGLVLQRESGFYDMFRGRILFPISDAIGNVVGFGGRTLGDDQPKYLNTPETAIFQKQRNLFGLYQSREAIQEKKQVVVVEGYTDCIAPFQAGVRNVVATLGTALTEQHVAILRRYADQIVLVFDADQAGQKAADRALSVFLTMGVDVKLARITAGKDPCDLVIGQGGAAFQTIIDEAIDALEYKWHQLQQRYGTGKSARENRSAVDDLLATIAGCDPYGQVDAIQRGMVISRLSTLLNVPTDQLHGQLQRYRRRPSGPRNRQENAPGQIPASGTQNNLPVSENVAQSAYHDLLEILICEPGYIDGISQTVTPDDFEPELFRQIAAYLWRCHEQLGEFKLVELLGTVEEPQLADIITQLHRQGTRKGNFARTLEDIMRCISDYQREQQAAQIAASLSLQMTEEETDRQLQAIFENLQLPVRRIPGVLVE